jgi:hypothetical protein
MDDGERIVWIRAHGAEPASDDEGMACSPLRLGALHEEALECGVSTMVERGQRGSPAWVARDVGVRRVFVVRNKRLVNVFDRLVDVNVHQTMDRTDFGILFGVDVTLAAPSTAGGTPEIVLSEIASGSCAEAAKTLRDGERKDAQARFDAELVARICDGVGRYVWSEKAKAYRKVEGR